MRKLFLIAVVFVLAGALAASLGLSAPQANASSHREAPLISQDPAADGTDFYMFVSPDKPDTVTFIANYYPFEDPAGGPNFYRFGDDVLYRISVDNDGDAAPEIWYDFQFQTHVRNGNTFLFNTGAVNSVNDSTLNIYQTYTFSRNGKVLASSLAVPPSNVGTHSMPNYQALFNQGIHTVGDYKVFAGQAEDSFFVDLGATFDLLTIRPGAPGNHGGGNDDLAGYNVQTIAVQVPISKLTADGKSPKTAADANAIIGAWTSSYRRSTRVLKGNGTQTESGNWVQVSRLSAPLVNEVVVPLAFKDYWNSSQPSGDAIFLGGVQNPEPAKLLNLLYGLNVPATPRSDLVAIFLTGIPGVNQPAGVKPSEMMRLNMAIPPSQQGKEAGGTQLHFGNRCGVLGGDLAGYPNGRRLSDDVVDISLQAVAGGTPFTAATNVAPNNQLGDGVDENDVNFSSSFPYVAGPQNGFAHAHHRTQSPPGHGCNP
jgi:hypothetical protein